MKAETSPKLPDIARQATAFRPAWWLQNRHAQTIASRLLRPRLDIPLRRERIDTPDGDFVDLDFADAGLPKDAPLVLLLHGLEGSARRGYALNTYRELAARGIRAVGLNFRGCSGEPNRLARYYHSGDTEDVRHVVRLLMDRFPDVPRAAIGFSLGGNVLLKYLGEEGDAACAAFRAAAAISVPYDLEAGARFLTRSFMGRFYTNHFLRSLRARVRQKLPLLEGVVDWARVQAARTFHEFDDAATAPIHGFRNASDYYRRSSCGPLLDRIRVRTLLVHAEDDPITPPSTIPRDAVARNPNLIPAFTRQGGHVGFISGGTPWAPVFWAERLAAEFLAAHLH